MNYFQHYEVSLFSFIESIEERVRTSNDYVQWAWLFDLQCTCCVMIGRVIHGGIYTSSITEEEQSCQHWLNSVLVRNGTEERENIRGIANEVFCWMTVNFFFELYSSFL